MSDSIPLSDDPQPGEPGSEKISDCFAPPAVPCECYCLHCHRVFMSDQVWFQKVIHSHDGFKGFWMCPTPNCGGAGFTFDIFPTDPAHAGNEGWHHDDDEEEDPGDLEFSDDDEPANSDSSGKEYDPAEPGYAQLDEEFGDDDDDIEGEEWKHGLAPGERPADPPWVEEARLRWEEEQKKYDGPDERPRVLDWSDQPKSPPRSTGPAGPAESENELGDEIDENDIPF